MAESPMYCAQCGSEQADGAKFCGACGAAIAPAVAASTEAGPVSLGARPQTLIVAAVAAAGVAVVAVLLVLLLEPFGGDGSGQPPAAPGEELPQATVPVAEGDTNDASGLGGGSSESLQVGDTVTILNPTGDSIALRVTPSMIAVTLGRAANGSTATITGGPAEAEGYTWYEIQTSEGTGWTRSDFLQAGSQGIGGVGSEPDTADFESVDGPPTVSGEASTMSSGLEIIDIVVGSGSSPESGETAVVHYTGWLEDGTKFDSSLDRGMAFEFTIGVGQVIAGWDEGIASMKVGGKRRLIIHPELAYGQAGIPPTIPANATLIFDVELLDVR